MKKILTTPIKAEDLQDIRVGDVIYLTGTLVTCRDVCHRRLIELKRPIPYDLNGKAIFHAGPIVRKNGDKWEMVSIGPTTSMRMESFEREFIEQTGVKLVVGKGGMGPLTEEGCQKFKALHVIFPARLRGAGGNQWKRLKKCTGQSSECRSHCGSAGSKSSAR